MSKKPTLLELPLSEIVENKVALRDVNKETDKYKGMVDSIKVHGVINPIAVKGPLTNDNGGKYYALIDGLHRFTAAKDAGLQTIPCHVKDLDELQTLETQIVANIHKVETSPHQYSKQLQKILLLNPTMTASELASKLGMTSQWLNLRLGLVKLEDEIGKLVDEGKITLTNAYNLAKLPPEEQKDYLERAMTMNPQEFVPTISSRTKELRDALRQGRTPSRSNEFIPVPHLRNLAEIKGEYENPRIANELLAMTGSKTPLDGFKAAISWILNMDPKSIQERERKHTLLQQKKEEDKKKRSEEREQKKREEAAAAVASMSMV